MRNTIAKILELSFMIDGIDIALERTKELREKCNLHVRDNTINEGQNFAFDLLVTRLNADKKCFVLEMNALQKEL